MTEPASEIKSLSTKQRAFVNAYFTCGFNATKAASVAGYAAPNVQGSQLLANPSIQAEVQRRMAACAMSADEVLARLGRFARASMDDFLSVREELRLVIDPKENEEGEIETVKRRFEPTPVPVIDWKRIDEAQQLGLIKKFKYDRNGNPVIELHDPIRALELIGKSLRLFVDRVEASGPNGGPIQVEAMIRALETAYGDGDE